VRSEVAARAGFTEVRYAQVWEDADVLLEGLDVQPGNVCVSIASAGDNALAMLTRDPARVFALDLSPAQLACLDLRVAAFRELAHGEVLELIGSRASSRRAAIYSRCRSALQDENRRFWDARPETIARGIGSAGKFERYFALFRNRVLPVVHSRRHVLDLLTPRDRAARERFYDGRWNSWRWRLLFRVFFSRTAMGRLGRDPEFFRYVSGDVASRILERTRHALIELDPSENPYLHWILTGDHGEALPLYLRAEHFEKIRANLDRLEGRCQSIEEFVSGVGRGAVDRYNLSDLFEYVSMDHYHRLLETLVAASRSKARLAYWNMLAPRSRPQSMAARLVPLNDLSQRLHLADKAFFYSAFIVEEVI
jgi:S-adenosylmethionine-diacylglycerol 3-amino-3-carboxypropyl transferase